jgi:hypothetical protein
VVWRTPLEFQCSPTPVLFGLHCDGLTLCLRSPTT